MKFLFLFIDGVGLREPAADNPVNPEVCPALCRLFERHSVPIDACLSVEGLPQSATGQATMFTGVNAPIFMGRHCEGFPGPSLRKKIEEGNLFLKKVGQAIQETFPGELVTRQADDHFLVFASPEGLEEKIDSLNQKVHDLDPEIGPGVHVGGYPFRRKEENQQRPFDRARFACSTLKGSMSKLVILTLLLRVTKYSISF